MKEIDFQEVQEAQRVPKKLDPRKHTPRHIIITLPKIKDKERILKAAREKERVTYKGVPLRLSADFSKETLQARRDWQEVFQVMKGKGLRWGREGGVDGVGWRDGEKRHTTELETGSPTRGT